jgi:hypothetical protein
MTRAGHRARPLADSIEEPSPSFRSRRGCAAGGEVLGGRRAAKSQTCQCCACPIAAGAVVFEVRLGTVLEVCAACAGVEVSRPSSDDIVALLLAERRCRRCNEPPPPPPRWPGDLWSVDHRPPHSCGRPAWAP